MLSKRWLINILLVFFAVFFGWKAFGVWVQGNNGFDMPGKAIKPAKGAQKPSELLYKREIPLQSKYDVLMTKNLFAPQRTEILSKETKPDEKSKKMSDVEQKNIQQYFSKLTLYGMVITNDSAEALVSYPVLKSSLQSRKTFIPKIRRRNAPRISAKESKWVKAGDNLGDFKVVAIKPDRVLLKAGDQSYDLLLYDKENLKKREPAKPKAGPNVMGVTVTPKTAALSEKKETIPSPPKKEVADISPSKVKPTLAQQNLKMAREKNKLEKNKLEKNK